MTPAASKTDGESDAAKPTCHTDVRQAPADKIMAEKPAQAGKVPEEPSLRPSLRLSTRQCSQDTSVEALAAPVIELDCDSLEFIRVQCGSANGELYLEKFGKARGGKSLIKCIKYQGNFVTPPEFETAGGKKGKAWRKSVKHRERPLGTYLTNGSLKLFDEENSEYIPSSQVIPSPQTPCTPEIPIQDPSSGMSLTSFIDTLQQNIMSVVEATIQSALESFRSTLLSEFEAINSKIKALETKVFELEMQSPQSNHSDHQSSGGNTQDLSSIELKLDLMSKSLQAQQQVLEMKDRAARALNIVITGLNETNEKEDTSKTVQDLFASKLEASSVGITQTKHLGKHNVTRPRLILVTFSSQTEKSKIMKCRKKLAGTNIYINNDLTREQKQNEKLLRDAKKKLQADPTYENSKITIYRGKICIDGQPAGPTVLYHLGLVNSQ